MEQENTLCILLGRSNNNLINITEFLKNLIADFVCWFVRMTSVVCMGSLVF